ncbi:MAG: hypothetical protein ACFFA6_00520 [Promethearchaeota archaeon]
MKTNIPIWRIKYHPKNLDGICGRDNVKNTLKQFIKQKNFPHILFIGSEGIGKTTIAQLFAKEFLSNNYDANFKLIYADVPLSDDERKQAKSEAYISTSKIGSMAGRTITTPAFIQVRVKPFVQLKVIGDAPFKILVVKNFEFLGSNQQGFRRLMEIYGSNCRVILISTKVSSIIDPIVSRCQIILISRAEFDKFRDLIKDVAKNESLDINDNAIEVLFKVSEGKISKAIDLLQLCSISGKSIDMKKLYENSQRFQNDLIRNLLLMALRGDFPKSRDLARKIISNYKYNPHEIFSLLLKELNKLPLSKFVRVKLINLIADSDFRAIDGIDNDIQISALLSKICLFSECL